MVQFKQQQRRRKQKTIGPTVAQDFKTVHAASFEGGRRKGTLAKSGNVVVHGFLRHAAGPVQKDVDARHVHVAKEHGECYRPNPFVPCTGRRESMECFPLIWYFFSKML